MLLGYAPTAILVLCFAILIMGPGIRRRRFQLKHNFEWFKAAHPAQVRGSSVFCPGCGGNRIHARGLMQRTYMREHFCTTCGKTLYYSPENDAS
jgi:hypothetical protein